MAHDNVITTYNNDPIVMDPNLLAVTEKLRDHTHKIADVLRGNGAPEFMVDGLLILADRVRDANDHDAAEDFGLGLIKLLADDGSDFGAHFSAADLRTAELLQVPTAADTAIANAVAKVTG